MTALKPCRFCGETKLLQVDEGYYCDDTQFVWDRDLNIVRAPTGEPAYRDDDGVHCLACDARAPRTVWQADDATNGTMRLRTLEVWPEYDDEAIWRGRAA